MLSPTVSFSSLPLKVRNVKILHVGAVLCCSCNLHCVFWQTDGHLSSRSVLVYQSRPKKAVQNSESIAFSNDTWGHGLRNPIKFQGAVEKQRVRERDSARLYSWEQKIKVQEGGDRKAEQWAGSVLRGCFLRATGQTGSPIETHSGYVALCGGTWAWMHSSPSQRRSNYNKDIPLIRMILLLKLSECVFFSYEFIAFLDTW